jgi:hypothetical protein
VLDYGRLAETAREKQEADRLVSQKHQQLRADPCVFFDSVKAHLVEEMNKANVEMRKRHAAVLDQNHLPGFEDEVFLTYGTDALCRVGLGIMGGGCRVTAVISGPPNGYEISRREYLCVQAEDCSEVLHVGGAGSSTVIACPNEIAADIIAGILAGKFD